MTNPLTIDDLKTLFTPDFLNLIENLTQYSPNATQTLLNNINKSQTLMDLFNSFDSASYRLARLFRASP